MNKYYKYFFFGCIPAFIIIIVCSYFIFQKPSFKTTSELAYFAEYKQDKIRACESYIELLKQDSTNSKYILNLAKEWYKSDKKAIVFFEFKLKKKALNPNDKYSDFIQSKNSKIRDAGYYGKACMHFYSGYTFGANNTLDSISNKNYPGYNYLKGLISEKKHQHQTSLNYYLKERKNILFKIDSELKIVEYLYSYNDYNSLKIILKSKRINRKISPTIERSVYLINKDYIKYFSVIHQYILRKIDYTGFIAAIIITLIWLLYILKLSVLTTSNKIIILFTLLIAALADYPCLLLYDISNIYLNFNETGNVINDFIYCILGIGLIEEFCKLIPFLLIIFFFRKNLKTPMSYLFIGLASALSFSFTENLLYFTSTNLHIISERALYSIVMHLACTSIACYGVIIFIFKKNHSKRIINGVLYILLAIFIHGFYDFWLINSIVNKFSIIALFTLFFSVFVWVKILNSCLNSSGAYLNKNKINVDRLNFTLLTLLSSFICIEYIAFIYKNGAENSFPILKDSLITAITLIPFLSYRLSRIDIASEEFNYINILSKNNAFKLEKILDKKAVIKSLNGSSNLFPIEGKFKDRLSVNGDNKWFQLYPSEPISTSVGTIDFFLIKSKNNSTSLNSKNHIVQVRIKYKNNSKINLENLSFIGWGLLNIQKQ